MTKWSLLGRKTHREEMKERPCDSPRGEKRGVRLYVTPDKGRAMAGCRGGLRKVTFKKGEERVLLASLGKSSTSLYLIL